MLLCLKNTKNRYAFIAESASFRQIKSRMAPSIQDIWNRLHNFVQNVVQNEEDLEFGDFFNPPASENDIEDLEKKLDVKLPEDFKESLKLHNGMNHFPTGELLCTERVYDEWKVWSDLLDDGTFDGSETQSDPSVQNCWWSKKWVPIVADGGGNGECLDLDPGEIGTWGQVIFMDHEDGGRPVYGKSYSEWLDGMVTKMENGAYIYTNGHFEEKDTDY